MFLPTPSHGLFPAFSTPCTPCPFRHGMPARNQRLYCAFAEQTSQTPLTLLRLLSPAPSLTDALPSYVNSSLAPLPHSPPSLPLLCPRCQPGASTRRAAQNRERLLHISRRPRGASATSSSHRRTVTARASLFGTGLMRG